MIETKRTSLKAKSKNANNRGSVLGEWNIGPNHVKGIGGLEYSTAVVSFSEMTNIFFSSSSCGFSDAFRSFFVLSFVRGIFCCRGDAVVVLVEVEERHLHTKPIRNFVPSFPGHQIYSLMRWQPATCSMVSICKSCRNQRACDAWAKAWPRLGARGADVVPHGRVLAAGAVQVSYRPGTVSARETSGPRRVGAWVLKLIRAV